MSLATGSGNGFFVYRLYHPTAKVHFVEYRGRSVWMTDRQRAIWLVIQRSRLRKRRTTTAEIAKLAHCSQASVSRFLRRLDLWRFIDLATMVGRRGGTWVKTRRNPTSSRERDAWLAGARHTWESRKRARDLLLKTIRRQIERDHCDCPQHIKYAPANVSTGAKFSPGIWIGSVPIV